MPENSDDFIERAIVEGLIVSDEFAKRLKLIWNAEHIESPECRRIAQWCWNYIAKYKKVPGRDIQSVYFAELKAERISEAEGELIEAILNRISDSYSAADNEFNARYHFDRAAEYFRDRQLEQHSDMVAELRERGKLDEAESVARSFKLHTHAPRWRRADAIEPQPIRWHWKNVIPRAELALIAGYKGLGKSQIMASFAAITSAGGCWPDGRENRPRDVITMSAVKRRAIGTPDRHPIGTPLGVGSGLSR